MVATNSGVRSAEGSTIHCPRCGTVATAGAPPTCPKHGPLWVLSRSAPCASLALVREAEVMLALRAHDPWSGWWEIPGGFQNAGEHPADAALREISEELGVAATITGLLGIYVHHAGGEYRQATTYVGACEGEPHPSSDEVLRCAWFSVDALPERVIPNHLKRLEDLIAARDVWLRG